MIMPKAGTPAFAEFLMKARDPNSFEAKIIKKMNDDASMEVQGQVRMMLYEMVDVVPGQLFRDIGRFHEKFNLLPTDDPNHELPHDVLKFRILFMLEELLEYCNSVGASVEKVDDHWEVTVGREPATFDAEKAFDGLIDLVYVALGTAFLHRFPFNEGWARVQTANMAKVRASGHDDPRSTRKHSADIVKPEGWQPPVLSDLLGQVPRCRCTEPGGALGKVAHHGNLHLCEVCGGSIEVKEKEDVGKEEASN
jgi:predicted HAD superfamily Cof-like phosphohydrolase